MLRLVRKEEEWKDLEEFYAEDSRDEMVDDDSLSPEEAAFMKGWEDAEKD